MSRKVESLHIRTTEQDKSMLARAAMAKNMTVSQFILHTTMPVAEEIVRSDTRLTETLFKLDAENWNRFTLALDAPIRDIPALRELLRQPAPWER